MKKILTILFALIAFTTRAQCDNNNTVVFGDAATGCQSTNANMYFYKDSITNILTFVVNGSIVGDIDTSQQNTFIVHAQNQVANSYANTNTQDYYIGIFNASILNLDYYVYPTVGRNFSKIDIDSVNTNLTITSTSIPSYLANVYNHVIITMSFYDSVTVSPSSSVHFDTIIGIPGKTGSLNLIYSARKQAYIEDTPFKMTY